MRVANTISMVAIITIGLAANYPWVVAFTFGLLHGLGFAGALIEVGLPQHEIPLALLMFNVGVELGQILFVAVILAFVFVLKKLRSNWPAWALQAPALRHRKYGRVLVC